MKANKALKDGYYIVKQTADGQLRVSQKGANHEPLNHSEALPSWREVFTNILASMRAAGKGKKAVYVDATFKDGPKRKYYRASSDGDNFAEISVQDDGEEVDKKNPQP